MNYAIVSTCDCGEQHKPVLSPLWPREYVLEVFGGVVRSKANLNHRVRVMEESEVIRHFGTDAWAKYGPYA